MSDTLVDQIFDGADGDTREEVASNATVVMEQHGKQGYQVTALSHACDVSGDGPRWSIMLVLTKTTTTG